MPFLNYIITGGKPCHITTAEKVDYYAFGSTLPGRVGAAPDAGYRFGFNGQERDNEIAGAGNMYTAEYWEYDARLGRRWNIDPIIYSSQSPYACLNNNPLYFTDPDGLEGEPVRPIPCPDCGFGTDVTPIDIRPVEIIAYKTDKARLDYSYIPAKQDAYSNVRIPKPFIPPKYVEVISWNGQKELITYSEYQDRLSFIDALRKNATSVGPPPSWTFGKAYFDQEMEILQYAPHPAAILPSMYTTLNDNGEITGKDLAWEAAFFGPFKVAKPLIKNGKYVKPLVITYTSSKNALKTEKVVIKKTARDIISKEKKGSINYVFPDEYLDKTLDEITKLAKRGDKKAITARKLLTNKRFDK